jgi:hypothetical protein
MFTRSRFAKCIRSSSTSVPVDGWLVRVDSSIGCKTAELKEGGDQNLTPPLLNEKGIGALTA